MVTQDRGFAERTALALRLRRRPRRPLVASAVVVGVERALGDGSAESVVPVTASA